MATDEFQPISLPGIGGVTAGDSSLPPVVLLHGWGGCSLVWRSTLRRLSGKYRLVSLDLPGTGGTSMIEPCTVDVMAHWVLDAVSQLGVRRFALVGHSMGGNIAAHAAIIAPGRISRLGLVNAAVYSDRISSADLYLAPVTGPAVMSLARWLCRFLKLFSAAAPDRELGDFLRPWFRRCGYVWSQNQSAAMIAQMRALVAAPVDPAAMPLSMPILIVQGSRDPVVPPAHAHTLYEALTKRAYECGGNIEIEIVPGFHVPMDDHPNEFADRLDAFLGGAM